MKIAQLSPWLLLAITSNAFPTLLMEELAGNSVGETVKAKTKRQSTTSPQGEGALPLAPPPFDAASQYVSNQGAHAFVAPGSGDARGPCPGLNAMANHNYLPHNGVASITDFFNGVIEVFGMAPDLALFLATYGAIVDGNLLSWSINGGEHVGIGGSHNNYETDSSPTRGDLNQYGSSVNLVKSQFDALFKLQPDAETANYNLEVLRDFRKTRFQESIDKNPYYAYLPISGILVSQAAFTFIYRFMANKSAEYPEGILNQQTLKSFFSIYGDGDDAEWVPGHERIPDNWYKRNDGDQYSIAYFNTDILYFAETAPEILGIGCNKGTVDSYDLLDPALLTNGATDAEQISKNPVCFASAFAEAELPLITGLDTTALQPLFTLLNNITGDCSSIGEVNQSALTICPGFSLYGGPTGPVAPGAIQS
uniref:Heme-thiolate peroxidase HTP3 n=1 Tax=Leptoxyphium fumago TaxID=5474 RepID=A0A1B2IM24_LEPFU|nr:heme-thiolate peroxidase HTP3 [Leptoxyphium fumago]